MCDPNRSPYVSAPVASPMESRFVSTRHKGAHAGYTRVRPYIQKCPNSSGGKAARKLYVTFNCTRRQVKRRQSEAADLREPFNPKRGSRCPERRSPLDSCNTTDEASASHFRRIETRFRELAITSGDSPHPQRAFEFSSRAWNDHGERAICKGRLPTGIFLVSTSVAVSITETLLDCSFAT